MAKAKPPDLFTGQSYNLGGPMKSHCLWSCFDFVSSIDCMRHVPHTCICLFSHKLIKFEHLEYDKITLTLMTNEPMKISQIQVFTSTTVIFFSGTYSRIDLLHSTILYLFTILKTVLDIFYSCLIITASLLTYTVNPLVLQCG